jgi:hypothetical protein
MRPSSGQRSAELGGRSARRNGRHHRFRGSELLKRTLVVGSRYGTFRLPGGRAFQRRTRLVNSLLGGWSMAFGSGSWLETHLEACLALVSRQPNLGSCGITEQEVWDLVQQELGQSNLMAG